MRISEKMGLVYTALFLTVSVAVITQNSESIMAAFRGEAYVRAVDDIFTVRPGREQQLFVLRNDVNNKQVANEDLRLISQPDCGYVRQVGGSFVYSGSASCSGYQAFSYCIDTGRACDPASVALRLSDLPDPVSSIETGPVTDMVGLNTQADINGRDLEISNVHLGRTAREEGRVMPVAGSKLSSAAVEARVRFLRPPPPPRAGEAVAGQFGMPDMPGTAREPGTDAPPVQLAALVGAQNDATPGEGPGTTPAPPSAPAEIGRVFQLANPPRELAGRLARIDPGFVRPDTNAALDSSPFGTECSLRLTAEPAPAAMIRLTLKAPCLPNSRIEIRHARLRAALRNGHTGTLSVLIPALEERARVSVELPDGTVLSAATRVPELVEYDRVAIQWQGAFELDLHALEFGAEPGSAGDIWQGAPRSPEQARRLGGGFLTLLGDPDLPDPVRVEVYSLSRGPQTRAGNIDFVVTATANEAYCDRIEMLNSYRSVAGRLVGAAGLQFRLPGCGDKGQSMALKNALRDLIIAAN